MSPVPYSLNTARHLRLLATAWLLEPDRGTLERLSTIPEWPVDTINVHVDDAALEYSQLLLQQVPPYASLFLSSDGMLNGTHAEQAQLIYNRHDFEIQPGWRAGAADHLGVELHFLAYMIENGSALWREVLSDMLLTWAPICCLAVERNRNARLYAGVANATTNTLMSLT